MDKNNEIPSKNKTEHYNPSLIEPKWQSIWQETSLYQTDHKNAKKPFYNLMMFPYPSAEGLHVGNMYAFTGSDVYGRFKQMEGYDVFEPIGLDGFGIHSENYALKVDKHPMELADLSEKNYYRQLKRIGNRYDWSRTVETYKKDFYKWTQFIFCELFKNGLAYRNKSAVNFCPSCKTVLADEQVINGKCERCQSNVEKRNLNQWFFKITNYSDRLLNNIENLDWSEKVKIAQRQWIGRKEGIEINYPVLETEEKITVFTTRPDTNFGATFIALAPEHEFVSKILENKILVNEGTIKQIKDYVEKTRNKSDIERETEGRDKTGVFSGLYAVNQLTNYRMPIWISDFVLMGFGTGALVGVPGHDKRDFEFASKFSIEVKRVVVGNGNDTTPITKTEQVQEEDGIIVNSDFLNGMKTRDAIEKIMNYIEEKGYGKRQKTYHLRDWLISRQRYWGAPIPMIYCESCAKEGNSYFSTQEAKKKKVDVSNIHEMVGWYPVPDSQLPVELPFIENYKPLGTGKAPLAIYPEFYETTCPYCSRKAVRETDVSDTFLDSSWYFFRYPSTEEDTIFDKQKTQKWLPVTMYTGGAEHSVLHLLYARFITMVFHDFGLISNFEEPFLKFYAHGLIIKDGAKMSKSKGNVVIPDDYIKKFGADTLRTYLMFLGPFNQGGDFRDSGIEGMHRFLKRIWHLLQKREVTKNQPTLEAKSIMHKTIKGVSDDLENLRYNTAIAKLMTYYNYLAERDFLTEEEVLTYLKLLAPFAPHLTEELWEQKGQSYSIHKSSWPSYEEVLLQEKTVTLALQINGKLRSTLTLNLNQKENNEEVIKQAREDKKISRLLVSKRIKNTIYVPNKIVNFVVE